MWRSFKSVFFFTLILPVHFNFLLPCSICDFLAKNDSTVLYLKGINFHENLFSRMNFFDIARTNFREWSHFRDFTATNFREWCHFKYFTRIYFREWSNFFFFFNFFFCSIRKDIKCIRMEKILKKLIFVNTSCSFTSYRTEIHHTTT